MSQAPLSACGYRSLPIVSKDSRSSNSAPVWELQEAARWKHIWLGREPETPADSQGTIGFRVVVCVLRSSRVVETALTSHQVHHRCLLTVHIQICNRIAQARIWAQAYAIIKEQFNLLQVQLFAGT